METGRPPAITPAESPAGFTPVRFLPRASAAIASGRNWADTLDTVLGHIDVAQPDLAFVFVSPHFVEYLPDLLHAAWERSGSTLLAGSTTVAPIAERIEAEHQPAIAMLAMSLPGATLRPARFTQALIDDPSTAEEFRERLGIETSDVNGWLLLTSSHRCDPLATINRLAAGYPGVPIVGGVAAPSLQINRSWVFLNGSVYGDGAAGIAIGGNYDILPVLAQGCEPIGETWTITGVRDQWIESISNRPALTLLAETLDLLPADMQEEAEGNLVAGFAANEYQDRFARGDFLIRAITAVDWEKGAFAVAGHPRVGQTIQLHLRDAATAGLDLTLSLMEANNLLGRRTPVAALLHSSFARGSQFFGTPDHDAAELDRRFPGLPHAGMVGHSEIGPVSGKTGVHGYSTSIGIITRRPPAGATTEETPAP
ncbi:MAG: FIST C-terminal domain-containing protein [Thermomicrobiales bacterium]|nr:FIST C-terminal domain-containing protein [Thermomicrobiales bacterium]